VRGKNRKATVLIILADEDMDDRNARMAAVVRYNLDVSYGDKIFILACQGIIMSNAFNYILEILEKYFDEAYRPI
jgi:hypothetical protein